MKPPFAKNNVLMNILEVYTVYKDIISSGFYFLQLMQVENIKHLWKKKLKATRLLMFRF